MEHSKGNWTIGRNHSVVVTDCHDGFTETTGHTGPDNIEYYGGTLICESIHKKADAQLISAAPNMLQALKIAVGLFERAQVKFTKEEKIKICLEAINKAEGTSLEIAPGKQINKFLTSVK